MIVYSVEVRNAQMNQIEAIIGTSPKLHIYSGAVPLTTLSSPGTVLCTINLPADWLTAASAGSVSINGVWSGTASAAGTASYYRIYDSTDTTCGVQGTVTLTGFGGDMTLDDVTINPGDTVFISTYTLSAGNASN